MGDNDSTPAPDDPTPTGISPFLEKPLPCPACGATTPQKMFRTRTYFDDKTESDGHVTHYRWAGGVRHAHPPHYFVLWCPQCHFADIFRDYREPAQNRFHASAVQWFKAATPEQKNFIASLTRAVDAGKMDFPTALALHYIALFIQLLGPENKTDAYKIGRLYLRIAWLFRENPPESRPHGAYLDHPSFPAFLEWVTGQCASLPVTEREGMERSIPYFEHGASVDPYFHDQKNFLQVLGLISDLLVRCDQLDRAFHMVRAQYKTATDERAKLLEITKKTKPEDPKARKARAMIERANETMRHAGEIRQRLVDKMLERDDATIKGVLKDQEGATPQAIEAALSEKGIHRDVIARLKSDGVIPEPKKKRFGLF